MILKRSCRPDVSSALRIMFLAVAPPVLPWTPRAFSQTQPPPAAIRAEADVITDVSASVAATQERAVTSDLAYSLVQVERGDASQRATEARLDRLEMMLGQLLDEMSRRRNEQNVLEFHDRSPLNTASQSAPMRGAQNDLRGYLNQVENWRVKNVREAKGDDEKLKRDARPAAGAGKPRLVDAGAAVDAIAWSPDGKLMATQVTEWSSTPDGGSVRTGRALQIRDAETGAVRRTLYDEANVWDVRFSPGGKSVAAALAGENVVKLWDPATGKEQRTFQGGQHR
jgi:hypothetical protein